MQDIRLSSRLIIVSGGFGSGKSEYAINLALDLAESGAENIALIDLDLVNAYFRSREAVKMLENQGIKMVTPAERVFNSDLPIAGPGIRDLILNKEYIVIIDVGGDAMGAVALGTYQEEIMQLDYQMLMLVNPYRPFSNTLEKIITMKNDIETASGLKIDQIISNPNTGDGTELNLIIEKHCLVIKAAKQMNLPILELLILRDIYNNFPDEMKKFNTAVRPLVMYLTPGWLWR